jgi:hypothetical protein
MIRDHLTLDRAVADGMRCLFVCAMSILAGCQVPVERTLSGADSQELSITNAERQQRSDRIRAYFEEQLKRREIVATTTTRSGQTIDWIRRESQVEGGRIATPPNLDVRASAPGQSRNPYLDLNPGLRRPELTARTELLIDERAHGPAGTVPVVRFDVENYLATVRIPPQDPRDVLKKIEPPSRA